MCHSLSIHQLKECWLIVVLQQTSVNIHVQVFVWTFLLNSFRVCINLELLISLYKLLFYLDVLSFSIIPLKFAP